jgi:pimeloyl-ACP methyl ester carboxylesterase
LRRSADTPGNSRVRASGSVPSSPDLPASGTTPSRFSISGANDMNTVSSRDADLRRGSTRPTTLTGGHGHLVAGAGTPVVMLHSSLGSKLQWTGLAQRLATRYRVIALDLCGYGDNAMPAAEVPFTLDDEVRLVTERLDALVAMRERVHVVAHSYGGLVALRFAQRSSDRVASLSLYEPVVFRVLDDEDPALADARRLAERVARLVAAGRRHDAARTFVDFWSGDGSYASLPLPARVKVARRVDKLPLDFRAASCWPQGLEDLRAIVAPTLLLCGKNSPAVVQRIHALLTRVLPNRRVGSFDCGHMGPVSDPHQVNPWLEAFVDICAEREAGLSAWRSVVGPASWASAAD